MNRISRTVSAVVLSAALLVVVTPAAQARSLDRHQTVKPAVSWFDAALAWLSNLIVGAPQEAQGRGMATKTYTTPINSGSGYAVPMTGSCIDPNGCTFGGGGL